MIIYTCIYFIFWWLFKVLKLVASCRNGLGDWECLELLPGITWNFWALLTQTLVSFNVIVYRSGLICLAHDQVWFILLYANTFHIILYDQVWVVSFFFFGNKKLYRQAWIFNLGIYIVQYSFYFFMVIGVQI